MNWFTNFLTWTKIPMETPTSYGWFHLLFLVGGFLMIGVLLFLLRNGSEKQHKIVLFSAGLFLIIIEIYKQLFYTFVEYESYAWYAFPLQLCSTPMYLSVLVAFLKPSKFKTGVLGYLALYGLVGGLTVMFYPGDVFVSNLNISAHSMLWHLTLVFIGAYILVTKQFGQNKKHYWYAFGAFLTMIAFILIANISGYWLLNPPGSESITTFNMFFISPYYNSPWPVFVDIQQFSYVLFLLSYLFVVSLLALLVFVINYQLTKKSRNKHLQ